MVQQHDLRATIRHLPDNYVAWMSITMHVTMNKDHPCVNIYYPIGDVGGTILTKSLL